MVVVRWVAVGSDGSKLGGGGQVRCVLLLLLLLVMVASATAAAAAASAVATPAMMLRGATLARFMDCGWFL